MITSVTVALDILKLVALTPNLGLSDIARTLELNKSRTYRMLSSMCDSGYITQNSDSTYRLGYQSLIIGQAARQQINLVNSAESEIKTLSEQFDENIQIRVRDGIEMMQVYSRRSLQSLQVNSSIGNRRHLGDGASGKLLLAYLPQSDFLLLNTKQQAIYLGDEIKTIRQQSIAYSSAELTNGVGAIAVPLFNCDGECVACLSVSVPLARLTDEYKQQLSRALKTTGNNISEALGAPTNLLNT